MHPPLDRPHPDCQPEIDELRHCHDSGWKKYMGGCNAIKTRLDQCLRHEKRRILHDLNQNLEAEKLQEQELIRKAFDKRQTFAEYLAADPEYQDELRKKQQTMNR